MSEVLLPKDWQAGVFSDIAEVNPSVAVADLCADTLVSFLTMADVSENGRVLNHQIRPLCEVRVGFTRFEEDDVLFAKITPCMQNGKGAFARKLANQHGFGSTEFHVLRATEIGDAEFIYHLAQSSEVRSKAVTFFTGSAGQQRVDSKFFSCFSLLIPPLPQQRKIARILTTLDNLIEKTEALIAKYQAIKQGLMHDLFTRGVDANGKLRPPQSEAPELYKQSELGWIPKEWEVHRLGDHLERIEQGWSPDCETEPASAGEWGVLKTTSVVWEGFNCIENKRLPRQMPPLPQYEVQVEDVLMTRGGPNSRVGVVAHVKQTTDKLMLSDKIYRLVPKKGLFPRYLALALSSGRTQTHLSTLKTGLAESQTNISQEIVRRLWIGIPKLGEQQTTCKIIEVTENVLSSERRSLDAFRVQKSGLMQDLLTGKVPVKADEEIANV